MKTIYKKEISSKIEYLVEQTGRRNFSVIIDNINGFFQGSDWAKNDILLVENGDKPTYLYRVDNKTRLVFTKTKVGDEEKILLIDVLRRG